MFFIAYLQNQKSALISQTRVQLKLYTNVIIWGNCCSAWLIEWVSFCEQNAFFNQHGFTSGAANLKYNSRAASLYREKVKTLANQATRSHGTEVLIAGFQPGTTTSFHYSRVKHVDTKLGLHNYRKKRLRSRFRHLFNLISRKIVL